MTSAPAIGFEYQPSRLLARALTAVLVLAVLAIASCGFAWWLKPALVILALGLWLHAMRHRSDADVTAAGWAAEGGWNLHRGNGDDAMATLLSFRVLGNFVLLRLREPAAAGACASCGMFDACQGGCMAAKFFTGLPLDGPDPECVLGHGERELATVCLPDRPQAGPGHSRRPPGRSAPVFVPVDLLAVRAAT